MLSANGTFVSYSLQDKLVATTRGMSLDTLEGIHALLMQRLALHGSNMNRQLVIADLEKFISPTIDAITSKQ